MPVDPEISLQVRGGSSGPANAGYAPAASTNPLAAVESVVGIQQGMNSLRQFQQTFAARQRAGEILASAKDPDTGVADLLKDPLVAGFAPELAQTAASTRQTILSAQGEAARQGFDAFHNTLANLPQVVPGLAKGDFNGWDTMVKNGLNLASPAARPGLISSFNNMKAWLTHDLSSDPKEAESQINQRITAGLTAVAPDAINKLFTTPTTADMGNKKVFGGVAGPGNALDLPTGTFVPSGGVPTNELSFGASPAVVTGPYGKGGAQTTKVLKDNSSPIPTPENPNGAGSLPKGVGAGFTGPSQEQTAANTAAGTAGGNISEEMIARQESLPNELKRLDIMSNTLTKFQAGGGADFRTELGKALQGLKNAGIAEITDEDVNKIANSSLPDTQLFSSEVKPLVIGALKQAAQGTGRVMRSEVDAFLEMMNETTDPNALMGLLNQARYALQVGYDQAQKFTDYKQLLAKDDPGVKGLGPSDFFAWYNKQFDPTKLPGSTPTGLNLGPVGGAKGAGEHPKDIQDLLSKYKKK